MAYTFSNLLQDIYTELGQLQAGAASGGSALQDEVRSARLGREANSQQIGRCPAPDRVALGFAGD